MGHGEGKQFAESETVATFQQQEFCWSPWVYCFLSLNSRPSGCLINRLRRLIDFRLSECSCAQSQTWQYNLALVTSGPLHLSHCFYLVAWLCFCLGSAHRNMCTGERGTCIVRLTLPRSIDCHESWGTWFMYLKTNVSQILTIYCLWADCWYGACASGLPGIFGWLHMHYSIDLCISAGKRDVQKCQPHVRNPPVSSDGISR